MNLSDVCGQLERDIVMSVAEWCPDWYTCQRCRSRVDVIAPPLVRLLQGSYPICQCCDVYVCTIDSTAARLKWQAVLAT
jgi:hypothetical protein